MELLLFFGSILLIVVIAFVVYFFKKHKRQNTADSIKCFNELQPKGVPKNEIVLLNNFREKFETSNKPASFDLDTLNCVDMTMALDKLLEKFKNDLAIKEAKIIYSRVIGKSLKVFSVKAYASADGNFNSLNEIWQEKIFRYLYLLFSIHDFSRASDIYKILEEILYPAYIQTIKRAATYSYQLLVAVEFVTYSDSNFSLMLRTKWKTLLKNDEDYKKMLRNEFSNFSAGEISEDFINYIRRVKPEEVAFQFKQLFMDKVKLDLLGQLKKSGVLGAANSINEILSKYTTLAGSVFLF